MLVLGTRFPARHFRNLGAFPREQTPGLAGDVLLAEVQPGLVYYKAFFF